MVRADKKIRVVGKLDYYVAFVFWMEVEATTIEVRGKPRALNDAGIDVSNT